MSSKLVDFFGVAAAKSGTTWLHACLAEHPEVFMPENKELDFFSKDFDAGVGKYNEYYAQADQSKLWGEFSPSYAPDSLVAERIFQYNPKAKFIWMLREPVDRAYSHYCMACRSHNKILPIKEILSDDSEFVEYGMYAKQLDRFLKFFSRKQHLILSFEDLKKPGGPELMFESTCRFLNINSKFRPSLLDEKLNTRKAIGRFPKLYSKIKNTAFAMANQSKICSKALDKLRFSPLMKMIHKLNTSPAEFEELDETLKQHLHSLYDEQNKRLSELCNS